MLYVTTYVCSRDSSIFVHFKKITKYKLIILINDSKWNQLEPSEEIIIYSCLKNKYINIQ